MPDSHTLSFERRLTGGGTAFQMWLRICVTAAGRAHLQRGQPCQDRVFSAVHGKTAAVALADGAGSALYAREGAAAVARSAAHFVCRNFGKLLELDRSKRAELLLSRLQQTLKEKAQKLQCTPDDLAATVLLAAADAKHYLLFQLGDGLAAVRGAGGFKLFAAPTQGQYPNETIFVSSKDALKYLKSAGGELGSISAFALMSDGSAHSLYHKESASFAPALEKIVLRLKEENAQALKRRLQRAFRQTVVQRTTDDCSLALLVQDD